MMGSPEDEEDRSDAETQHEVTLTQPFALGRVPVTQALWEAVTGENPSWYTEGDDAPQRPVETVSWFDAVRFCNALSEASGLSPAYTIGKGDEPSVRCDFTAPGFRLPTEAEWEYAVRSADAPVTYEDVVSEPPGDDPQPVGGDRPTRWGFHDVGALCEWCWDLYGAYPKRTVSDPRGAARGSMRVSRGGVLLSTRLQSYPYSSEERGGLRLARTLPAAMSNPNAADEGAPVPPLPRAAAPSADFDLTAFQKATKSLHDAVHALGWLSFTRHQAILRYCFPSLEKFSWDFDNAAWSNDQITLTGEFTAHFEDGSEVALGVLEDWRETIPPQPIMPDTFEALRPHACVDLSAEHARLVADSVAAFLEHYEGDADTMEAALDSVANVRDNSLGLPDLLKDWSSPAIPWPPAPPEEAKKPSSRKKKR